MINHRIIDCFKVVIDIEPENDKCSRELALKWLEWVVDNRIDAGDSSSGPSGFTCYVNAAHREAVAAWLDKNIPSS